jgi:hypothetical protein
MSKPTPIGRPTVHEEDKASVIRDVEHISKLVADGEISAMLAITVRPDGSFQIFRSGDMKRIQGIGLLAQAQFDLLNAEAPYPPGRSFKPGA